MELGLGLPPERPALRRGAACASSRSRVSFPPALVQIVPLFPVRNEGRKSLELVALGGAFLATGKSCSKRLIAWRYSARSFCQKPSKTCRACSFSSSSVPVVSLEQWSRSSLFHRWGPLRIGLGLRAI